jgi:molecular chaperone GrpE
MTEEANETPALAQEGTPDPDVATPDAETDDRLSQITRERDEYYDRVLRLTAEFDNYRKRIERERRESGERAAASLLEELLPIVDDLERAQSASAAVTGESEGAAALRRGVELIHGQLLEVLRRRGVEPFDSVGQEFDPAWHEAIAHEPGSDRPEGEILGEVRRGYRVGQKLLRPAQVRVAKA